MHCNRHFVVELAAIFFATKKAETAAPAPEAAIILCPHAWPISKRLQDGEFKILIRTAKNVE
jgi:hypothetical protein